MQDSKGNVKIIRSANGSDFAGDFARLCDKHRIRQEFPNVGTMRQNGSIERSFSIFDATQMAAREQAHVISLDADISKTVDSL